MAAWRVLLGLFRSWRWQDQCYPSHEELAETVGCSVSMVRRGLRELEEARYIRTKVLAPQSGPTTEYWKTSKLIELADDRPMAQDMGAKGVLDNLKRLANGDPRDPRTGRARARIRALRGRPEWGRQVRFGSRGPKTVPIPLSVLRKPTDLTPNAWRVLVALHAYWQKHEWCKPSRETLAWFARCNVRSIDRGMAQLRKAGYIDVQRRYNSSNVYHKGPALDQLNEPPWKTTDGHSLKSAVAVCEREAEKLRAGESAELARARAAIDELDMLMKEAEAAPREGRQEWRDP
jgi:hypothetical protein